MSTPRAPKAALVLLLSAFTPGTLACGCSAKPAPHAGNAEEPVPTASDVEYARARQRMVRDQIEARGVRDPRVLDAMRRVPRHLFVPEAVRAPGVRGLPRCPSATSRPSPSRSSSRWMTDALQVSPRSRVLEIGTGSGYQAAVLAEIVAEVYTIEIVAPLAESARRTFEMLGYANVHAKQGDGYARLARARAVRRRHRHRGARAGPAAARRSAAGRRPARRSRSAAGPFQQMTVITKKPDGVTTEERMPVRFVPLVRP